MHTSKAGLDHAATRGTCKQQEQQLHVGRPVHCAKVTLHEVFEQLALL